MKVIVDISFEKDAKNLHPQFQVKLKAIIESIQRAPDLKSLDINKLKGYKNAYRIRMGDYRVGFYLEDNTIVLSRVLNRREIYRYFPKK